MPTAFSLLALLLAPVAAADPPTTPVLIDQAGAFATVELPPQTSLEPGQIVAVYSSETRADPRTGQPLAGLRYAGDARVVWVGGDLATLQLAHPEQVLAVGEAVAFGERRSAAPTTPSSTSTSTSTSASPSGSTTEAEVEAETVAAAAVPSEPAPEARSERPPVPTVNDAWRERYDRSQAVVASLDWSDDGYDSGVGTASLGWAWVPERTAGRVAIRLEGVRGARWVASTSNDRKEPWAREPAVGYFLWTELEGPWVALAPVGGLAVGVQGSGPTAGVTLGLRSGLPHAGHARVDWTTFGDLGSRFSLSGAIPLSDRLRFGPRARAGDLPRHEPPPSILPVEAPETWRQQRADGSLRLTWDAADALTLTAGGGLAGYDLLFADAGPTFDTAVELRW